MTADDHRRFEEDLAAYVLGALPELEAQRLESHLRRCQSCQEEEARLRPVVDALPRSVPQVTPPATLKENLMATVRSEAVPDRRPAGGRWSWPRIRVPAIAATAALAVGIAAGIVVSGGEEERSARQIAAQVDADRLAGAEGTLVVPAGDSGGAVLRMSELPEAGRGRVYEVWVSAGGRVRPASLFEPRRDGTAVAGIDADLADADAVLVTRERRGGVANPTEDPVIAIPL